MRGVVLAAVLLAVPVAISAFPGTASVATVPEPALVGLLALGLLVVIGLIAVRRRR
jgi:hypothetical protein